ncbi:MAG: hypothetical protein ABSD20_15370 [Terriglobales bacterium]
MSIVNRQFPAKKQVSNRANSPVVPSAGDHHAAFRTTKARGFPGATKRYLSIWAAGRERQTMCMIKMIEMIT